MVTGLQTLVHTMGQWQGMKCPGTALPIKLCNRIKGKSDKVPYLPGRGNGNSYSRGLSLTFRMAACPGM